MSLDGAVTPVPRVVFDRPSFAFERAQCKMASRIIAAGIMRHLYDIYLLKRSRFYAAFPECAVIGIEHDFYGTVQWRESLGMFLSLLLRFC
jgi:hypothetical protein